jgi:hypothetical protein
MTMSVNFYLIIIFVSEAGTHQNGEAKRSAYALTLKY